MGALSPKKARKTTFLQANVAFLSLNPLEGIIESCFFVPRFTQNPVYKSFISLQINEWINSLTGDQLVLQLEKYFIKRKDEIKF
ncbi:hypothetical protein EFB08_16795 [Rufibacter latericius]|uniref:Uncharacterized protein n=1 Tax=Rufibacter latericius TaxID=2487040 RepID=A0A3M9MEQ8_9BACT|nr:hypothetical protein EFB08_16795 [Rufibacter latericius]